MIRLDMWRRFPLRFVLAAATCLAFTATPAQFAPDSMQAVDNNKESTLSITSASVPEPATYLLIGAGFLVLSLVRRPRSGQNEKPERQHLSH